MSRLVIPPSPLCRTEHTWFTGPWAWRARVAALPAAAVALSLLIASEQEVEEVFAADAGVAQEALISVEPHQAVISPILSLGRPMPSKPLLGQRKPPCEPRVERAINGACWIGPLKGQEPPCGPKLFDYEGECYVASFDAPKQPTSEQP